MAHVTQMLWLLLIPAFLYFLLIIFLSRNLSGIDAYSPGKQAATKISVVVACRNEELNIPYLLCDITAQDYPQSLFEVIIVDDWSWDSTPFIVSSYGQIDNLKILKNTGRGKKNAIRTGVEAAEHELIMTTDADCRYNNKWISTIASFYEKNRPDLIIGPVGISGKQGFFQKFQELEFLSLQAVTAGASAAGNPIMCNGANLAFSKNQWLKQSVGLKKELLSGDDVFFLHSLKEEKGSKIFWLESDDALVTTKASPTFLSFLRQRARWVSKSFSYSDRFTIITAIITFITILELPILFAAGFMNPLFFKFFAAGFFIKSLGDFILLSEMTRRRNRRDLLLWFLPSQVIYPFYVLAVSVYSLFWKNKW